MNSTSDFELTAEEINELKRLLKHTLANGKYHANFFPLTEQKKIKQYLSKITQLQLFFREPFSGFIALPKSMQYLSNLETLEIDYSFVATQIEEHEHNLGLSLQNLAPLNKLHSLSITDSNIIKMPDSIGQLKQLQTLHLRNSGMFSGELTTLPESIGQLENLRTLSISNFPNLTFPESLWQLNQLEDLKIFGSNVNRLPENIGQLKGLKTLQLNSFYNINSLPDSIGQLDNLQTLYIASCPKLSSIPENIAQLKNLNRLDIVACEKLRQIPQSIQQLSCFTYYEDYYEWNALRWEEAMKKNKAPKQVLMLNPKQKQAKKVVAQMKKDTATPFIKIKAKKAKKLPLTASKFGGVPYWLPEMPYPVDKNGEKLALLAQIDLAELPPLPDFPTTGLLQFFISNDDLAGLDTDNLLSQKGYRVVYHASVNPNISEKEVLNLAIPLENMPLGDTQYKLSFKLAQTSISPCDYRFEDLFKTTAQQLKITFDKNDEIFDLIDEDTHEKLYNSTAGHHIGGYPIFTQDDPRSEEQLAEHKILLLQIDSEGDIMWGDAGVGNFFITLDDLRKKDFSRVLYHWDCA